MKNFLIGVLVVVVIVLGYLAFKPLKIDNPGISSLPPSVTPTGQTTTINNPNGKDYQPNNNLSDKSSTNTTSWVSGNDGIVSFSYPSTWKIMNIDQPRPDSVHNAGTWIVPPSYVGSGNTYDTGDAIVITENKNADTCNNTEVKLTRCTEIKDAAAVTIFTKSNNAEVLKVYDQLVKTVK